MAEVDAPDLVAKTVAEVERTSQGIVKRWLSEIAIADKAQKEWRKEVDDIWQLYEGAKKKANSFNILWSNTETLAPALYNSTPNPDVRRRYRDRDPLGKAASTVIERECAYQLDQYDFDASMQDVVLDTLICGRGVSRKKYEPSFAPQSAPAAGDPQSQVPQEAQSPQERLTDEIVENEHVQWDKFRHGPGKRWKDVTWLSYEHEFTYEMAQEKFGDEIAEALKYSETEGSKDKAEKDDTKQMFKVCTVHEIWDRDQRRVLFIAPSYKEQPCRMEPDPLQLKGFFPSPRPVYAIANTRTLVPVPPYRMYENQAKELDLISARINKIVNALKVRGAYSANLPEIASILSSNDNDMTPVQNVSEIASTGGLDKAIWIMPIDKLQLALTSLYEARDQIKMAIYEISGIGDIMRGVTDPNETKGAQVLKSQWGSLRLQKMQREVQRYVRDLTRIDAEIVAERFSMDTLMQSTNVKLPNDQEKMQAQVMAQQAQQMGQPLPPEVQHVLDQPTWPQVMQLLRTDALRSCRIDIETDSTVAETITRDMEGLTEVIGGLGELITGAMPAMQAGVLPVEAVKEIANVVVRRARMGPAVEDAIDQIQAPPTAQADPKIAEQAQKDAQQQAQNQVKEQKADQERQQATQQINQAVQDVNQAVQMAQKTASEQQQTAAMERALLVQIVQKLSEGQAANSTQTMQALQQATQALGQIGSTSQAANEQTLKALQDSGKLLSGVIDAIGKPKKITFDRGGPGNRIQGAVAN